MNYDFFHAIRARHVNVDSAAVHCGFGGKRVISLYLILPCLVSVVTLLHLPLYFVLLLPYAFRVMHIAGQCVRYDWHGICCCWAA